MRPPRKDHVKFKEAQTSRKVSGPTHSSLTESNVHELNSRSVSFRLIKESSPQTVFADKITPLVPNPAKSSRGRLHLSMHVFLSRQKYMFQVTYRADVPSTVLREVLQYITFGTQATPNEKWRYVMNLAHLHIGSLPTPAHRDSRLPMLPSERKFTLIPSGGVLGPLMVRPERPERDDAWRPFKVITRAVTGYDMRLICTHARCMPS